MVFGSHRSQLLLHFHSSQREQQHLIQQAEQHSSMLESNPELHANETLLEIGYGVGAVLVQIGLESPEAHLCGIESTLNTTGVPCDFNMKLVCITWPCRLAMVLPCHGQLDRSIRSKSFGYTIFKIHH